MSSKSKPQFTVYNHESGVNVFKILILLRELGLTYEFVSGTPTSDNID
jgi:glutathione S-transferase